MTTTKSYDFLNRLTQISSVEGTGSTCPDVPTLTTSPINAPCYEYDTLVRSRAARRSNTSRSELNIKIVTVIVSILALCGCSQAVSDSQWEKTVPGVYEGKLPNFREVLGLNTNGTFNHKVFINKTLVVGETGQWAYDVKTGIINLEPFTLFYDKENRKMTTNGVRRAVGALAVLRYGKTAGKISISEHTFYCLNKKQSVDEQ